MMQPMLTKNDTKAKVLIWVFSAIIFLAIILLERVKLEVNLGFDPHIFAFLSASVNSLVAVLLLIALWFVKNKNYAAHKNIMLITMALSVLFLVFYIAHHLFTGETKFGDSNHDGVLSLDEKAIVGTLRYIYYILIGTHILLAGIVMPFVLFSAYRAMIGEYALHKRLVRYTFPIWLYVAISGVLVYVMISPYY